MLHNLSSQQKPTSEKETTIQISIMFSVVLSGFSKPNSCLLLLFFLSFFHLFSCARTQPEDRRCDSLFKCGNLTAGFPFWGVARPQTCGHPSLGLHCNQNSTFLVISSMMYLVLEINITTSTLRLVRQDFSGRFCSASFSGATLTPELFQLLPNYKTLSAYFLCRRRFHYPANFTCGNAGVGSMHQNDTYHKICGGSFNISVPIGYTPEEEALNVTKLESVLRKGFEVKLMIDESSCQECESTGGLCAYAGETPVCCKTGSSSELKCTPMIQSKTSGGSRSKPKYSIGMAVTFGFLGLAITIGLIIFKVMSIRLKRRKTSHHRDYNLKALLQLKQYSYAEVKKITKSFSHTVGKGGFGTVYGGTLSDGRKVAVKILRDLKSNGEDFINEVASMSQTSHVNIVSLLGFCYEGSKRAIVYEFLENGSLDQFISNKNSLNLDIGTLYGIALGVARGLEYLHHGCKTRIVHFDIKPQNVLLDDNLCPKVSDFGLARLCEKRESILSLLDTRGTIGYIAPEVFSRVYGRVSHKSDVYSFGMLVLEMIGARNKESAASNSSSAYFPDWIYKDLENGEHTWRYGNEITREENVIAKKMTLVGLWCIQPCPSNRPPMNRVVEMMEGSLDALEVPPKPSFHFSSMPLTEHSSLSEENSIHN